MNLIRGEMTQSRFLALTGVILAGICLRLLPMPSNFSPMIAIALFAGVTYKNKTFGALLPIMLMALTDIFLGFHGLLVFVYGSMALVSLLGSGIFKEFGLKTVTLGSLSGSVVFYLVTNFGVWFSGTMYAKSLDGLITCYIAGLPFLQNTVLSTLVFSSVLLAIWQLVDKRLLKPVTQVEA